MAEQAKVASIDAIDSFRGRLIIFMENATRALDEIDRELRNTKNWLEGSALNKWLLEKKRREQKLYAAEQELTTARLSVLKETETLQQMAVRKARRSLEEAEQKVRVIKRWTREYEQSVYPLARHLQQLRHHINQKLPISVAKLAEIVKTLDAYSDIGRSAPSGPPLDSGSDVEESKDKPQIEDPPTSE